MKNLYLLFGFLILISFRSFAQINAENDNNFTINYTTGGTTASVFNNDTLNGSLFSASAVTLSIIQIENGLTLNANGTVTVAPNLPIATYSLMYQICEIGNPNNCDSASVLINVISPSFNLHTDYFDHIDGLLGQTTSTSIYDNDTFNGNPINLANVTVIPSYPFPGGYTLNPNGTITIAPHVTHGAHYLSYKIIENANPSNFQEASITINVDVPNLDVIADGIVTINGITGGSTPSVFNNDTINGIPLTGAIVNTSIIYFNPNEANLYTINANGIVTVPPNTPAGIYYVQYNTCLTYDSYVCDQDNITLNVINSNIYASADTISFVNSPQNTTTNYSVLANDFLNNGIPNGNTILISSPNLPSGFTLNPNGTITVALGTAEGTYSFSYQICEVGHPNNCSTGIVDFSVTPNIFANQDYITYQNGINAPVSGSLLTNDTLNGQPATQNNVTITAVNIPNGFTLNADGTFNVALGTPSGSYSITYQIFENGYPTNFAIATATIVLTNGIEAVVDVINYLNAPNNSPPSSVIYNDLLNGDSIDPYGNIVTITPINFPTGFSLDPYGNIYVALGTPAGSYTFSYQICEINNPNNCAVGIINFNLSSNIVAVQDQINFMSPNGGTTTESVLNNDTLNNIPAIYSSNDITLSTINIPAGIVLNNDGTITIPNNYTYGNYSIDYQICESYYTTNCSTSNVSLVIVSPFAPTGPITQNIPPSGTLAGLQVNGQNIKWYSAATNKSNNAALTSAIPSSTPAVAGTTYYATQTINGIESTTRLAVTISGLSTDVNTLKEFNFYPNPTKINIYISNNAIIDEVEIFSILGKIIITKKINDLQTEIDLSQLLNGIYFVKVKSEGQEKTVKIIKE